MGKFDHLKFFFTTTAYRTELLLLKNTLQLACQAVLTWLVSTGLIILLSRCPDYSCLPQRSRFLDMSSKAGWWRTWELLFLSLGRPIPSARTMYNGEASQYGIHPSGPGSTRNVTRCIRCLSPFLPRYDWTPSQNKAFLSSVPFVKTFLSHRQEKKGMKKVVSCQLRLWLCSRLCGNLAWLGAEARSLL